MKKPLENLILVTFLVGMIVTTILTSFESNLFLVLPELIKIPWFNATLIDFYFNQLMLYGILLHLEKYRIVKTLPWLVAMICLGSMATSAYLLYYLNIKTKNKGVLNA